MNIPDLCSTIVRHDGSKHDATIHSRHHGDQIGMPSHQQVKGGMIPVIVAWQQIQMTMTKAQVGRALCQTLDHHMMTTLLSASMHWVLAAMIHKHAYCRPWQTRDACVAGGLGACLTGWLCLSRPQRPVLQMYSSLCHDLRPSPSPMVSQYHGPCYWFSRSGKW